MLYFLASTNSNFQNLNQKHSRYKKELKRSCWKRCEIEMGWPRPSAFDRIKNFDHHDLTAEHCYFWCSSLLMLMGSKFLTKMIWRQNIVLLRPGPLSKIFILSFIRRP